MISTSVDTLDPAVLAVDAVEPTGGVLPDACEDVEPAWEPAWEAGNDEVNEAGREPVELADIPPLLPRRNAAAPRVSMSPVCELANAACLYKCTLAYISLVKTAVSCECSGV